MPTRMIIGKKKASISNRKGLSKDDIVDFLFASGVFPLKEESSNAESKEEQEKDDNDDGREDAR